MYRWQQHELQVLLVHPGGPVWAKKDLGAWSIPKGERNQAEESFAAALREFKEETGLESSGPYKSLGAVRQSAGKTVVAWAFEGDCDVSTLRSNLCRMEWPPRSGRHIEFAEIDRGQWFSIEQAINRIVKGQAALLQRLVDSLAIAE